MTFSRLIKHVLSTRLQVKRHFPERSLAAIKSAIGEAESTHKGEICFAIEPALPLEQVMRGMTAHERALEVFSELRVWDTEYNNGVLIYILFADRAVEIVADRGICAKTVSSSSQVWQQIASIMEKAFAGGQFEAGAIRGVAAVAEELTRHFSAIATNLNELPNEVRLL